MSDDVQMNFQYIIIITEEEKTWQLPKNQVLELPSSNQVEADTRIIMEALKSESTVTLEEITLLIPTFLFLCVMLTVTKHVTSDE